MVSPIQDDAEFDDKNTHRIHLIHKKYSESGLTDDEHTEFHRLQQTCFDYLRAKYPMIPTDMEHLSRIEARLDAKPYPEIHPE